MSGRALVLGGGPDGLAAAGVLARAGRRVLLLEEGPDVRGAAAPLAVGPRSFPGATGPFGPRPFLARELELERHGLRPARAAGATFAPDPAGEGPGLVLEAPSAEGASAEGTSPTSTAAELAAAELGRAVPADEAAWRALAADTLRLAPLLADLLDRPPPDPEARGLRELLPLLGTALALRRQGERATLETARLATLSLSDHLGEHLSGVHARAALAADGLEGVGLGPRAAGTALAWLANRALRAPPVAGGATGLADALAAAARAAGAELRAKARVEALLVEDGALRGARLAGGEVLEAELAVATVGPRRVLLELLPPTALPAAVARAAARIRARGTTSLVLVAARGEVRARARPGLSLGHVLIAAELEQLERAADACALGQLAADPWIACDIDASAGPAVLCAQVHGTPYDLAGGWSEARRDELARFALERLGRHLEGLDDPEAVRVLAPPDLERELFLDGGHLRQAELSLDQMLFLRPIRACAAYRTPVRGLYLGGPGSHPGGAQPGSAGLLAARAALRDA